VPRAALSAASAGRVLGVVRAMTPRKWKIVWPISVRVRRTMTITKGAAIALPATGGTGSLIAPSSQRSYPGTSLFSRARNAVLGVSDWRELSATVASGSAVLGGGIGWRATLRTLCAALLEMMCEANGGNQQCKVFHRCGRGRAQRRKARCGRGARALSTPVRQRHPCRRLARSRSALFAQQHGDGGGSLCPRCFPVVAGAASRSRAAGWQRGFPRERVAASAASGGGAAMSSRSASSSRLSRALNTWRHCPQRTFPARALSCSEVTRKIVWQPGQQVFIG
jgi:hypothetical protein